MDLIIRPFEGIGPIEFGMTVGNVGEALGGKQSEEFLHNGYYLVDLLDRGVLEPDYNENHPHFCDAVSLARPTNPILLNRNLLKGRSFKFLKNWLKSLDNSVVFTSTEVLSPLFGISLQPLLNDHNRPSWIKVCSKKVFKELLDNSTIDKYFLEGSFENSDNSDARIILKTLILDSVSYYQSIGFFKETSSITYTDLDGETLMNLLESTVGPEEFSEILLGQKPEKLLVSDPSQFTGAFLDPYLLALDAQKSWTENEVVSVCPENQEYIKALQRWSKISNGIFAPELVQEDWSSESGPISVEFTLNGERHHLEPEYCENWLDYDLLYDINMLIEDTGYSFVLNEDTESKLITFLTEEEKMYCSNRALEFDMDMFDPIH